MNNCNQCHKQFEVTTEEIVYSQKIKVPLPTLCNDCRHQRRLAFRNERKLYQRNCDLCKESIVSVYSPDKSQPVYCSNCWWSDKWDPKSYGRDFDFSRPFFEQFAELMKTVPALANNVFNSINSEYNSFCSNSKDCYRSTRVGDSEKVMYSYLTIKSFSCIDCSNITDCQYCYECFNCQNCYNVAFSQHCKTTSDSAFCYDCIGCKNCFGCSGLRNCEYYIYNKKFTKEEYKKFMQTNSLCKYSNIKNAQKKSREELLKYPRRPTIIMNSQNAYGDYIIDSKDVKNCFDVEKSETVQDSWGVEYSKNIVSCHYIYYGENCYENISNSRSSNIFFSAITIEGVFDLMYCFLCVNNTNNCFGSVSLNKNKYCILNKQYSKEEYHQLVEKIIEHMKKAGEYGEFFPITLSPFAYNETVAYDYYPLSKEQILSKKWQWKEESERSFLPQTYKIPDDIKSVEDEITKEILACTNCGKNYKIAIQELDLYRKIEIAIPEKCPDCRYTERMSLHNPRKLWNRACAKCHAPISTSYAPDRQEIVYCEPCYLNAIY